MTSRALRRSGQDALRAGVLLEDGADSAAQGDGRRLAERGVRFIQLYHRDWDHHNDLSMFMKMCAGFCDRVCQHRDMTHLATLPSFFLAIEMQLGLRMAQHGVPVRFAGHVLGGLVEPEIAQQVQHDDRRMLAHVAQRQAALAQAILDAARQAGYTSVLLDTLDDMEAARALYEALGFTQVGRRRGYYQHPSEDALLLRREIGPG